MQIDLREAVEDASFVPHWGVFAFIGAVLTFAMIGQVAVSRSTTLVAERVECEVVERTTSENRIGLDLKCLYDGRRVSASLWEAKEVLPILLAQATQVTCDLYQNRSVKGCTTTRT